jgi:glycosyltransferase involved in cell wall biosynthesis
VRLEAIVPAYNEAPTVAGVVAALHASPSVARVLVVDDGSTDGTGAAAQAAGADVLTLTPNGGKGAAMRQGVAATTSEYVLFVDSDLIGLTPAHVGQLVAIADQGYDMVCGMQNYGGFGNAWQLVGPLITGQRVVRRSLLAAIPLDCWSGYAIETAMNAIAKRIGAKSACVLMENLSYKNKITKSGGFWNGMAGHAKMFRQIGRTLWALEVSGGQSCPR